MNRALLSVYCLFNSRFLWLVLACLLQWLTRSASVLERRWSVLCQLLAPVHPQQYPGRPVVAIGMLVAGWLGATQAQGQTCGTYRFTTTQFASVANVPARTSGTFASAFGIPLGNGANNTSNITDVSLTDAAQLGVLLSGSAQLSTQVTSATLPAGATAGYVIADNILNLGVGQTIEITTYLNGTQQNQGTVSTLLDLPILGSGTTFVGIATTKPFNEIQVRMSVLIGAAVSLNVYYPMAVYDGTIAGTNPTTVGGTNGTASIALIAPGATGQVPLTYAWSNSGNTSTITGLPVGVYSGTISSGVGCLYTSSVTLTGPSLAPGGVSSGLQTWYKADQGVTGTTAVTAWADLQNGRNVIQATASHQPSLTAASAAFNFNPSLVFEGTDQLEYKLTRFMSTTSSGTMFGAASNNTDGGYENLGDLGIDNPHMGTLADEQIMWMNSSVPVQINHPITLIKDQTHLFGYFWNGGGPNVGSGLRLNGVEAYTATTEATAVGSSGIVDGMWTIGGYQYVENWHGNIAEVLLYDRNLTTAEKNRVETYMALKYGTTLAHDYLASDGTTIYSVASYSANITGIGRDDNQTLSQKQSKSVNANGLVTIGLGTSVVSSQATIASTFAADKSFAVFGDNGLSASYATAYVPNSFSSNAPYYIMSRIWKVQETGTVGTVTISIPGSTTGTYLLVKSSSTFATGATEIAMTPDGNGNLTAQVDLVNGQFFTFAKPLYSPGCVAANLLTWYKADMGVQLSGSAVTQWTDQQNGYDVSQATVANRPLLQAASTSFNFNPSIKFDGVNDYLAYKLTRFISTTASGTMFGAASNVLDNGGYENLTDLGIDNPHMGLLNSKQIMWLNGSAPVQIDQTFNLTANQPQVYGYYFNSGSNNGGVGGGRGLRLDGTDTYFNTTASSLIGSSGIVDGMWTIGSYEGVESWNGNIAEIILYDRSLTTAEKDRVDTYLAVKYGATLAHNYLSGAGTTIYNVSSFSANVTGIGRDDCQQLNQKQSKSVNSGAKLTIGVSNTIAATNATNAGSFTSNSSFIVFGDNGLTGLSSATAGGACPPPPSADKWTNLAYKVTETGSVASVALQFDAGGLGFNSAYSVWMQIASDAAFTNLITAVPMSLSGSTATGTYDFPANSTVYVRFAGNTTSLANICVAPKMQTFHWNGWYYGDKTKTITSNYGLGNTLSNPVMKATVTDGTSDANVLLYKPTVNWWPVFDGLGLFIPRNDNNTSNQQNSIVTTKMQFFAQSSLGVASTSAVAAQGVDFILRDIDGWIGGKDVVKVYGKLGGVTVIPKISKNRNYPFWNSSSLTINNATGVITGGWYPWDLTVLGNAYVNFDSPVEEVYVEYTKQNQYSFKVYNDLRIGAINVTCKQPTPRVALADNVYLYKQVSPNPEKVGELATYKFTIQSTDCANKVINFNDVLPPGLTWVDSTATSDLDWASINNYGNGQTLSITSLTVTPGTSYLYASVRGTSIGTFNNQATYVVTNGTGASLLSDDPGQTGTTMQPTPLTLTANDPEANLVVTKSVDKTASSQNSVLTYTYNVYNPNGSAIATTFQDLLPGELTFVGGSLSGLSGTYTSSTAVTPYSGSAVLAMRNLSVPASSTLTFSIQANVNSYTVGQVATNIGQISPDILAGYRIRTYTTNAASTTITANASFSFNCGTASVTGSFTANGAGGQTGTLTIPILGATAGPASISIGSGSGFATVPSPYTLTLTAGQTSIVVPITFAGTGSPGIRTLTVVSPNATGTCSPTATIQSSAVLPTIAILSPANNSTVVATPAPIISGTATPGATVVLSGTANANLCTTTADASGNWSCAVGVPSGPQTITATATNSGGSVDATTMFTAVTPLAVNGTPATITAASGQPEAGNAATTLNPGGGTLPYVYTAFNPASGSATSSGTSPTPHGTVTVDPVTGAYTYTPTPGYSGTDAIGIKVCDSGTPQQCRSTIIPVSVSPQPGLGSIDCSKILLTGVQAGTASQGVLKLTINVTQTGLMPVTVSGSGLSLSQSPYNLNATTLGIQNFYVPVQYDGTAFGPMVINVGGAGTCAPDLTGLSPKVISQPALNLGDTCTPPSAATLVK